MSIEVLESPDFEVYDLKYIFETGLIEEIYERCCRAYYKL